ncbi:MAG: hypothetical protein LC117_06795 [Bacteroidia bacterium]|nr:hypothetical protein [Bacteroidia bacterium]MCZ2277619.1 hypothetical protein [Bacteroidia bacterium]
MNSLDKIQELISRWLAGKDFFLVEVKLLPGKLLVYLDSQSGIQLDECADLNRFLFNQLEESGFTQSHTIEVSSPGLEHPFKVKQQYLKNKGKNIRIQTTEGEQSEGLLIDADDSSFTIRTRPKKNKPSEEISYNYESIKEATSVISFKSDKKFNFKTS